MDFTFCVCFSLLFPWFPRQNHGQIKTLAEIYTFLIILRSCILAEENLHTDFSVAAELHSKNTVQNRTIKQLQKKTGQEPGQQSGQNVSQHFFCKGAFGRTKWPIWPDWPIWPRLSMADLEWCCPDFGDLSWWKYSLVTKFCLNWFLRHNTS